VIFDAAGTGYSPCDRVRRITSYGTDLVVLYLDSQKTAIIAISAANSSSFARHFQSALL